MSVAITVKVSDGFAIAADSATTLANDIGTVSNIYNSTNKIANLYKDLPIGLMYWDAGSIGGASMATIAKDLRKLLQGTPGVGYGVDPANYTMQEIADKVKHYFYDDRYLAANGPIVAGTQYPSIGMYVCGFGTDDDLGKEFEITIEPNGHCGVPVELNPGEDSSLRAFASPDPVFRLVVGASLDIIPILENQFNISNADALAAMVVISQSLYAELVHPAMPIIEAIDLAEFLVKLTIMYYRFRPGHNTVGGPIEVAAITKHEGFKWIKRKLYYEKELNP
jgi:hypothetical protein